MADSKEADLPVFPYCTKQPPPVFPSTLQGTWDQLLRNRKALLMELAELRFTRSALRCQHVVFKAWIVWAITRRGLGHLLAVVFFAWAVWVKRQ